MLRNGYNTFDVRLIVLLGDNMQAIVQTGCEQVLVCGLAPGQVGQQALDGHGVLRNIRAPHYILGKRLRHLFSIL